MIYFTSKTHLTMINLNGNSYIIKYAVFHNDLNSLSIIIVVKAVFNIIFSLF